MKTKYIISARIERLKILGTIKAESKEEAEEKALEKWGEINGLIDLQAFQNEEQEKKR